MIFKKSLNTCALLDVIGEMKVRVVKEVFRHLPPVVPEPARAGGDKNPTTSSKANEALGMEFNMRASKFVD